MQDNQFHNAISRELGGINENLKNLHNEMIAITTQVTIANGRTRKLEDWRLKVKTQTAMISAIVSGLVAIIVWLVTYLK